MPAKTPAQANFMRAVAHSPEFAKKVGVKQSIGREFGDGKKPKPVSAKPTQKGRKVF